MKAPMSETRSAIRRLRKSGMRRGLQGLIELVELVELGGGAA